eukprot:3129467-Rhodomonas_salina.1
MVSWSDPLTHPTERPESLRSGRAGPTEGLGAGSARTVARTATRFHSESERPREPEREDKGLGERAR